MAAVIVLGGAFGVSAFEDKIKPVEPTSEQTIERQVTEKETPVVENTKTTKPEIDIEVNKETDLQLLSVEEVIQQVEQQYGATVVEIELDEDDGWMMYEIEMFNEEENSEIELEINAKTGEVIDFEKEYKKHNKHQWKKQALVEQKKQAIQTALSQVDGHIIDVEYEDDENAFEIKVKNKNGITTLTIDENNEVIYKTTKSFNK